MKTKNTLKKISKSLLAIALAITTLLPSNVDLSAAKTTQYFWSSLYDSETKTFRATIVDDDYQNPDENQYSYLDSPKSTFPLYYSPTVKGSKNSTIFGENNSSYIRGEKRKGNAYPYTFPGNISHHEEIEGNSQDRQQASSVSNKLTNQLNEALRTIVNKSNMQLADLTDKEFFELAFDVVNNARTAYETKGTASSTTFKKITYQFKSGTMKGKNVENNAEFKGTAASDYVTLIVNGKEISTYQFSVPKGYHSGQRLEEKFSEYTDLNDWMPTHLTWCHVLYQAYYCYKTNFTAANISELSEISSFEALIAGILGSIINNIQALLGLYSLDELMLNSGNRATETYQGTMPRGWFVAVSILYTVCMVVALIVIGYSVVKLMIQKNLSTINATQKVSLMEGIKDLGLTAVMLSLFYPAFLILCRFNTLILEALYALVANNQTLQSLLIGSNSTGIGIGAVLIAGVALFAVIKVNITYAIRSLTIGLLFCTSPYFISTFAIPGKKEKFWSWLKELLANIFMQSFDGVIAVFLILILGSGPMRAFERLALALAMISLSSYFKNSIMKMGSDSEKVAATASGIIASGVGNAMVGVGMGFGRKINSSKSSEAKEQGSSTKNNTGDTGETDGMVNKSATGIVGKIKEATNNPFVKGAGHLAASLGYTGVNMGTQIAGGRTLWGEKEAISSFSKAQDEIWDNGIVSGTQGIRDKIMNNKYINQVYDHEYSVDNLSKSGLNHGSGENAPIGSAPEEVNLNDGWKGKVPETRSIKGVKLNIDNGGYNESRYTKEQLRNIGNRLDSENDGVRISYWNANAGPKGEDGRPVGAWTNSENLSVKEFKSVLKRTPYSEKIRLDNVYQGGGDYANARIEARNEKIFNEDKKDWESRTVSYRVKNEQNKTLNLYDVDALAGKIDNSFN